MSTFRFQSKHAFLTYPKCNLGHQVILDNLRLISDFTAYTASTEKHSDNTEHVHVLLRFARKLSHRDERHWDINNFHPNIVCPRAVNATREYIKKDGNFVEDGWEQQPKPYSKCLADSSSKAEFLSELREHHTRDYVLNYERICSMADAHWKAAAIAYTPEFKEFLPCEPLTDWVNSSLVS